MLVVFIAQIDNVLPSRFLWGITNEQFYL